jgi:hypothetical protein
MQGRETQTLASPPELTQLDRSAPIEPRPAGCIVPLTAEQQRLFNIWKRADPDGRPLSVRMCAGATRIVGPLNVGLLQTSLAMVVRRHESLRTRVVTRDGITTQQIDAPGAYRLEVEDLSGLPPKEAESDAKGRAYAFQNQKIDLSAGPVFEARLFKLSEHEHVLMLAIDHIVSDGVSNSVLTRDIWVAYDDAVSGRQSSLPSIPLQFADYAVWQARTHQAWKREHEAYWMEHLAGTGYVAIPASPAPLGDQPAKGCTVYFPFGAALSAGIREAAKREQTTPSVVGLAIYALAMSLWCRLDDLVIRCPVSGRRGRPELENVIGFVANVLYLRIRIRGNDSLRDLMAQAAREMRNAFEHLDFDRVPDLVRACVTDLAFHWRSTTRRGRTSNGGPSADSRIRTQPFFVRLPDWPWLFWSVFDDTPAGICATVHYWPHRLATDVVNAFGSNIRTIAQALVERPLDRVDSAVRPAEALAPIQHTDQRGELHASR